MMYLFVYDIADTRRRLRISKVLEQFGLRVQKSFFQCDITSEIAESIKSALCAEIDKKQDSLFIYPVCSGCLDGTKLIGMGNLLSDTRFEIL
jgi:CRISPR-associated protein Cas2